MTITRTGAEAELVRRCGRVMTAASMDTSTAGNFESALAYALRQLGLAPSAIVTDVNLSGVALADTDKFYDLAEYRQLDNILGNFDLVDIGLGPRRENYDQIRKGIEKKIDRLEKKLKETYGIGGGTLTAGVYRGDWAEHDNGTSYPELEE